MLLMIHNFKNQMKSLNHERVMLLMIWTRIRWQAQIERLDPYGIRIQCSSDLSRTIHTMRWNLDMPAIH